uniref:Uncharacterized protein n=1 Tax=Myoviridae sp. ctZgq1 TaxID=2826666 RepID=A0A8S5LX92_9CAUD|nr:MAG TPA: hypothetical protein [Myoviridae sp. ctZgq1]
MYTLKRRYIKGYRGAKNGRKKRLDEFHLVNFIIEF